MVCMSFGLNMFETPMKTTPNLRQWIISIKRKYINQSNMGFAQWIDRKYNKKHLKKPHNAQSTA